MLYRTAIWDSYETWKVRDGMERNQLEHMTNGKFVDCTLFPTITR